MVSDGFFYELVLLGLLWLYVMLAWAWPSRCVPGLQPPTPSRHPVSAPATPSRFLASPTSPTVRPVSRRPRTQRPRHLPPHRHRSPPAGAARARSTPPASSAPIRTVPIMAGWAAAISRPTAIPAAAPGANGTAPPARAISWRPTARRCMASASPPTCWCGPWARWRKGWASAPWPGCSRSIPTPCWQWLVEAADHLQAFSQHFLHDVRVTQVQLDELYALLRAVKDGEVSEAEALQRLSRSPHWVWVAIDPVTKLLLALDVGDRTLAMAQRVVHQVVQVLAPGCVPLFLTDGFKEYATALLTHYGQWVQPARRQATGPVPKPRWMPLPQLLYAQVIKTVRRRRLVRVQPPRGLRHPGGRRSRCWRPAAGRSTRPSWSASTSPSASMWRRSGRRVMTLCKGEDGLAAAAGALPHLL